MKCAIVLMTALLLSTTAHAGMADSCMRVFDSELKMLGLKPINKFSLSRKEDFREIQMTVTDPTNITAVISKGVVSGLYLIEIRKNDLMGGQEAKLISLTDKADKCAINYIQISSLALGTSTVDKDACFRLTTARDLYLFLRKTRLAWEPLGLKNVAPHMELPMAHMCSNYYSPSAQLNMFD